MASLPYASGSTRDPPGSAQSKERPHSAPKTEGHVDEFFENAKTSMTEASSSSLDLFGAPIPRHLLSPRLHRKARGQRMGGHRRSESVPEIGPRYYEGNSDTGRGLQGTTKIVSSPVMMAYDQGQESPSGHSSPFKDNSSNVPPAQDELLNIHKTYAPKMELEGEPYNQGPPEVGPSDQHSPSMVPRSYMSNSGAKWVLKSQGTVQAAPHDVRGQSPTRNENLSLVQPTEDASGDRFLLREEQGNNEMLHKDVFGSYSPNERGYALDNQKVSSQKDNSATSSNEKIQASYEKWSASANPENQGNTSIPYQQHEAPSVSHLVEAAHQIQQFHGAPQGPTPYQQGSLPGYDVRYPQFGYNPPVYIAAPYSVYSQGQGRGPQDSYPSEPTDPTQLAGNNSNSSISSPAWVQLAPPPQRPVHINLPMPLPQPVAQADRVRKSHRRTRSKSQHARSKSLSRVLDVSNTIYAPTSVLGLEQQTIPEDEQDLVGGNYWGIISTSDSEDAPPIPIQLCEPPLSDSVPANVEALKPDPEPRNKKRSKYTADQDSIILELKAAGANWAEIADRANCDNSLAARNRYQVLIGQQGGGTYTWNQSDCEALQSLLDEGERAKWIFIAEEMSKRRNKKYTVEACHYKISQLFAENPEAFEVVRSREKIGGGAPMRHRPLRSSSKRSSSAG